MLHQHASNSGSNAFFRQLLADDLSHRLESDLISQQLLADLRQTVMSRHHERRVATTAVELFGPKALTYLS